MGYMIKFKFGFDDVMSSAWMEHTVRGSWLTEAQLCEQTHSAIARMSMKRNGMRMALRSYTKRCKIEYIFDTEAVKC